MSCPTESTTDKQKLVIYKRAGGRCEAEVWVPRGEVWTRCFRAGIQCHHGLTRARGGDLLDRVGETYHLFGLCPQHHDEAHSGAVGYEGGLMIEGYVILDSSTGEITYLGPDDYLLERYGNRIMT